MQPIPRIVLAGAAALTTGCAPVFSDLQSATLAGRGRVEVTPSASIVHFAEEDTEHVQDHFGVQLATGVHEKVDLRVRYERIEVDGGDDPGDDLGVNVLGSGPKVSLVRDRLAVALPAGLAFGEGIDSGESWELQPTLVLTLLATKAVELNASAKYIIPLTADEADNLVALNLGLGLGPSDKWVLRPEVGFLWNPGEEGHFRHLSLGFTFLLGAKK